MRKIQTPLKQYGLIGYFDILGYQNLLRNNNDDASIKLIFDLLEGIPEEVRSKSQHRFPDNGGATNLSIILDDLGFTVFSDTIIMSLPIPKNEHWPFQMLKWGIFTLATALLQRLMFDHGLPIRGAISIGDFWLKDSLLAGRPIISAHDASNSADAAIVVLDRSAEEKYRAEFKPGDLPLLKEYPIPRKDGSAPIGIVLDFTQLDGPDLNALIGDTRAIVTKRFSQHRKFIAPEVLQKLNNTEMFIRIMKPPVGI